MKFSLNGNEEEIDEKALDPQLMLIDYLRDEKHLSGPKKPCGQGGCGGCTVIISSTDDANRTEHRAINSCLRPVTAIGGLNITTIEGSQGRITEQDQSTENSEFPNVINPVSRSFALNYAHQCGYCTSGFVMNTTERFQSQREAKKKCSEIDIEDLLDGNLCRCTGFRPIITACQDAAILLDEGETYAREHPNKNFVGYPGVPHDPPGDNANGSKGLPKNAVPTHRLKAKNLSMPRPSSPSPPDAQGAAERVYDKTVKTVRPIGLDIDAAEGQLRLEEWKLPAGTHPTPVSVAGGKGHWHCPANLAELQGYFAESKEAPRLVAGNTSYGLEQELNAYRSGHNFISLAFVSELKTPPVLSDDHTLSFGASTTYRDLIDYLKENARDTFSAFLYMLRRTAGAVVRNAATIGGNTMAALKASKTVQPFPSDTLTYLWEMNAMVTIFDTTCGDQKKISLRDLFNDTDPHRIVLVGYEISEKDTEAVSMKVAIRSVNSHSLMNATAKRSKSGAISITYSALPPCTFPSSVMLKETASSSFNLKALKKSLKKIAQGADGVDSEGVPLEYRIKLCLAFATNVIALFDNKTTRKQVENWEVSRPVTGSFGVLSLRDDHTAPIGSRPIHQSWIKPNAVDQTTGHLRYLSEKLLPTGTLYAAYVVSHFAAAGISDQGVKDLAKNLSDFPEFRRLITVDDIPKKENILISASGDQPLLACEKHPVRFWGQPIAIVLATSEAAATRIAQHATQIANSEESGVFQPTDERYIVDLQKGIEHQLLYLDGPKTSPHTAHILQLEKGSPTKDAIVQNFQQLAQFQEPSLLPNEDPEGTFCVRSAQKVAAQLHFYMERQVYVAEPLNQERWRIYAPTASPNQPHDAVSTILGKKGHEVEVEVPPVGGGFGGKNDNARLFSAAAAVSANVVKAPVKLTVERDVDSAMAGRRHGMLGHSYVKLKVDKEKEKYTLAEVQLQMYVDGGAYYDCTFIVTDCIQYRADNAYDVKQFRSQVDGVWTNASPGTSMRGFGAIQGNLVLENGIFDACATANIRPEEVRLQNLYRDRGSKHHTPRTPFGQELSEIYIYDVYKTLKEESFDAVLDEVNKFNAKNQRRKRGVSMIPVKYGSGYNYFGIEQAAAVLSIEPSDGSVFIHQGGVELGQGLEVVCQQVVAAYLGCNIDMIHIQGVNTTIIPSPTSTGASIGTVYAAESAKRISKEFKVRLQKWLHIQRQKKGDAFFRNNVFQGHDHLPWESKKAWAECWSSTIAYAHSERFPLVLASDDVAMYGGEGNAGGIHHRSRPELEAISAKLEEFAKEAKTEPFCEFSNTSAYKKQTNNMFTGFTYSTALTVVEVDVLTGEVDVLRSDVIYDMGASVNPIIDIGQVEGAFIQGLGMVLSEDPYYNPKGELVGRNTWAYKLPTSKSIPREFNVKFWQVDERAADLVLSAKEVGEPPLILATTAFFAVKDAVLASRVERGLSPLFKLACPATPPHVAAALEVRTEDLGHFATLHE